MYDITHVHQSVVYLCSIHTGAICFWYTTAKPILAAAPIYHLKKFMITISGFLTGINALLLGRYWFDQVDSWYSIGILSFDL